MSYHKVFKSSVLEVCNPVHGVDWGHLRRWHISHHSYKQAGQQLSQRLQMEDKGSEMAEQPGFVRVVQWPSPPTRLPTG